jgi:hypothetical protein
VQTRKVALIALSALVLLLPRWEQDFTAFYAFLCFWHRVRIRVSKGEEG